MSDPHFTRSDRQLLAGLHITLDDPAPELTPDSEARLWAMLCEQNIAVERLFRTGVHERRRGNRLKAVGKRAVRAACIWRAVAIVELIAIGALIVKVIWRAG